MNYTTKRYGEPIQYFIDRLSVREYRTYLKCITGGYIRLNYMPLKVSTIKEVRKLIDEWNKDPKKIKDAEAAQRAV